MKMMPRRGLVRWSSTWFALAALSLWAAEEPMDWTRARQLHQRAQRGEALTTEEQAYYDRARRLRQQGVQPPADPRQAGTARSPIVPPEQAHFPPLTELGAGQYKGEDGGLYGGGRNDPPKILLQAAQRETARIRPLNAEGQPDESGRVVLLALGMSNTTQEFSQFKRLAEADPQKAPSLVIVDGAQGGQDARKTATEDAPFWSAVDARLKASEVTPQQVQVVWLKQAMIQPREAFPADARRLQELLSQIVRIAAKRYPNLRLIYLSSRTYGGYAMTPLNPEPHAYESAFAVRWLIQEQLKREVKPPVLLWGPYLWSDGAHARKSDGLVWTREDTAADGTHPSPAGRQKVAQLLLTFFKTDALAQTWFGKGK